jgi:TolB-like protein
MQSYAGSASARARVGVLPLYQAGKSGQVEHIGLAMTEDICMALSRFRVISVVSPLWLAALARNGHDETNLRSVCRIDLLLSGSIQRNGDRLRVHLRLFDLRTDHRAIWAHSFDRENGDILALLDEISTAAVGRIIPHILLVEAERTAAGPLLGAPAYGLVLSALPLMKQMDRFRFAEAGSYLAAAIERAPDYSPAYTWFAFWHLFLVGQGWAPDRTAVMRKARELAATAVLLDPGDPFAMTVNAHVSDFRHQRMSVAADLHERALAFNPNLGMAWALSAATYCNMGEADEAAKRYSQYQKLGPFEPSRAFFADISMLIHLLKRDYDAAVLAGRTAMKLTPSLHAAYKPYLSALGHLHLTREGEAVRKRLLSIEPDFSVQRYIATSPLERDTDRDHFAQGLRLAGVPEISRTAA